MIRHVDERLPDLVITDIRMPPDYTDEGLRAALRIRASHPQTPIVVLSQHVQRRYAVELLADNAAGVGYLLKQRIADIPTFCADLDRVRSGGTVLDPEIVALMLARADRDHDSIRRLTQRQQQVLGLMAEGRTNGAIAHRLRSPRRPSCSTRPTSTTSSACRPARTTTAASWPSSAT